MGSWMSILAIVSACQIWLRQPETIVLPVNVSGNHPALLNLLQMNALSKVVRYPVPADKLEELNRDRRDLDSSVADRLNLGPWFRRGGTLEECREMNRTIHQHGTILALWQRCQQSIDVLVRSHPYNHELVAPWQLDIESRTATAVCRSCRVKITARYRFDIKNRPNVHNDYDYGHVWNVELNSILIGKIEASDPQRINTIPEWKIQSHIESLKETDRFQNINNEARQKKLARQYEIVCRFVPGESHSNHQIYLRDTITLPDFGTRYLRHHYGHTIKEWRSGVDRVAYVLVPNKVMDQVPVLNRDLTLLLGDCTGCRFTFGLDFRVQLNVYIYARFMTREKLTVVDPGAFNTDPINKLVQSDYPFTLGKFRQPDQATIKRVLKQDRRLLKSGHRKYVCPRFNLLR